MIDLLIHWSLLDVNFSTFGRRIKYFESLYLQQKPSAIKIKKICTQINCVHALVDPIKSHYLYLKF